jgi:hypothetical protein
VRIDLKEEAKKAQKLCDEWNEKHPDPIAVILTNDFGQEEKTRTRSIAWEVCGSPVVKVEGRTGGYLLTRIRPDPEA